jgi:hypothetical protein
MTQWRMRQAPGFPNSVDILGTDYFYEDELEAYEESRRHATRQTSNTPTAA